MAMTLNQMQCKEKIHKNRFDSNIFSSSFFMLNFCVSFFNFCLFLSRHYFLKCVQNSVQPSSLPIDSIVELPFTSPILVFRLQCSLLPFIRSKQKKNEKCSNHQKECTVYTLKCQRGFKYVSAFIVTVFCHFFSFLYFLHFFPFIAIDKYQLPSQ